MLLLLLLLEHPSYPANQRILTVRKGLNPPSTKHNETLRLSKRRDPFLVQTSNPQPSPNLPSLPLPLRKKKQNDARRFPPGAAASARFRSCGAVLEFTAEPLPIQNRESFLSTFRSLKSWPGGPRTGMWPKLWTPKETANTQSVSLKEYIWCSDCGSGAARTQHPLSGPFREPPTCPPSTPLLQASPYSQGR